MKWIEFKDGRTDFTLPASENDLCILEYAIDKLSPDYDNYKQYLISILMNLSYCYMELWDYSESSKCLKEALSISEESNPHIFFRLAQTKINNKYSKEEDWAEAMSDLTKAKRLIYLVKDQSKDSEKLLHFLENEYSKIASIVKLYEESINSKIKCK